MKRQNDFKTRPNMAIPTARPQVAPSQHVAADQSIALAALSAVGETISRKTIAFTSLLIGAVIGLTVFGWWLWPVEYTGASYGHLSPADKALIVEMASDLNAYDTSHPAVIDLRARWAELDGLACLVATQTADEAEQARLRFMALRINQQGCE